MNYAVQKGKIIYFSFSDHDGVSLTLKLNEPDRGPGMWKMNNSVIESGLFKNTFESFWNHWKNRKGNFEIKWNVGRKVRSKSKA